MQFVLLISKMQTVLLYQVRKTTFYLAKSITLRNTIFVWLLFSVPLYVFLSAELKNPVSFFVSSLLFEIFILFVSSDLAVASRLCSTLQ